MLVVTVLVSTLYFLLVSEVLFPKKEKKKSLEEELKEAVAKYVSQSMKLPKE